MTDKPKMAPRADAPPGIETDNRGNIIPFDQRTKDDREKARRGSADALPRGGSIKNPEHEAQTPAAVPGTSQGSDKAPKTDLAGQQGGTDGGGRG